MPSNNIPRKLLPAEAGGPLYHDRGTPTAKDLDNMRWCGVKDWDRYVPRREFTPEEYESWLMGGGG